MYVKAYGKINLYLDVLDRRPDGFTNIETIFQTVDLHDTLTFEMRDLGLSMSCDDPALDTGPENLVMRAARLLQQRTGVTHGVHVHLEKRLPVAGGMAGGSADAAATLRALNERWDLNLNDDTLAECALELGSDVPYCLVGGTVAATGRGEILEPLDPIPETYFVLLRPELGISAGAVYNHPNLTRNDEPPFDGKTRSFERAINVLRAGHLDQVLFNRMESAILKMHPELTEWKQALLDAGCSAAIVSGSGPAVFGLAKDAAQAYEVAQAITLGEATVVRSVSGW